MGPISPSWAILRWVALYQHHQNAIRRTRIQWTAILAGRRTEMGTAQLQEETSCHRDGDPGQSTYRDCISMGSTQPWACSPGSKLFEILGNSIPVSSTATLLLSIPSLSAQPQLTHHKPATILPRSSGNHCRTTACSVLPCNQWVVMALIFQSAQMCPGIYTCTGIWSPLKTSIQHCRCPWAGSKACTAQRLTASEGAWKTAQLPVWWCSIGWLQTSRLN